MTAPTVPLVDLAAVHAELRDELLEAMARVLDSGRFVLGDEVEAFEREVARTLQVPHAVGLSNGTDALVCALSAAGVRAGDVVLTTAFSFIATVTAILRVGAVPRFCDIDPHSFNLEPRCLSDERLDGVKAVVVVHLFGRAADVAAIAERVGDIPIVQDAAQAFGARTDAGPVGALGQAAAFSFFPGKPLGALGDGGLLTTSDPQFAEAARRLRVHGRGPEGTTELVGGNYRLDALQAACLRVKLPHEAQRRALRGANARAYDAAFADLPGVTTPNATQAPDGSHVWSVYALRVNGKRDALRAHLASCGVESAIYYPRPLPRETMLGSSAAAEGQFPEAERACREVLALPVCAELGASRVAAVIAAVRGFFGR